jgi:hypothetical protein
MRGNERHLPLGSLMERVAVIAQRARGGAVRGCPVRKARTA